MVLSGISLRFYDKKIKKKNTVSMRFLKKLLKVAFLCALALALIALGYYLAVTNSATLQPEKLLLSNRQITIYDQRGEMVNTAAFSFQKQV